MKHIADAEFGYAAPTLFAFSASMPVSLDRYANCVGAANRVPEASTISAIFNITSWRMAVNSRQVAGLTVSEQLQFESGAGKIRYPNSRGPGFDCRMLVQHALHAIQHES